MSCHKHEKLVNELCIKDEPGGHKKDGGDENELLSFLIWEEEGKKEKCDS